jgi:ribosomal protein S18 acetylase RimI-like enzyme
MAEILIRRAIPDDAAAIGELRVAGWETQYRDRVDDDWLDEAIARQLSREQNKVRSKYIQQSLDEDAETNLWLIAEDGDDESVGYLEGRLIEDKTEKDITILYVAEHRRGEGIGSQLLGEFLDQWYPGWPCTSLKVAVCNRRAQGFYERHGFKVNGDPQMLGGLAVLKMYLDKEEMEYEV